jgi:GNAT superfamily N-acetyltransferase
LITHFLGPEEVDAFARDLSTRLIALGDDFPKTWFLLGVSGQIFANVVLDHIPDPLLQTIRLVRVNCNRETRKVEFADAFDIKEAMLGPCLLIDSAVHSGETMLAVCKHLTSVKLKDIITYTLVLKRNATMVPNYFGVLMEENDRCLFQLDSIPNNRLCKSVPFGILRTISAVDVLKELPSTGTAAIDTTFSALLYEKERGSQVFVYEHNNEVCGVLSFEKKGRTVFIDLVANSEKYRGRGIGAAMMRWAETWARSTNCEAIELWAIQDRIDFYKARKFVESDRTLDLGDAKYRLMRRKLLYNTSMIGETA